jgi:hypothetical protein
MLNISDRKDIFKRLSHLTQETKPRFGKMTAQHMVEHLILTVRISDDKEPHPLYYNEQKAIVIKNYTIYTDKEIIEGFRAPMLPPDPTALKEPSLEAAIEKLKHELEDFDLYFADKPDATPTNPTMGPLKYDEWLIFHSKHFNHHFKQFNLL